MNNNDPTENKTDKEETGWEFPEDNSEPHEIQPDDYDKIDVDSIEELENHHRPLSPELKEAIEHHKKVMKILKAIAIILLLIILYLSYIYIL